MKKSLISSALSVLLSTIAVGAHATDFNVLSNSLSTATFTSEALLETVTGTSTAVTGTITTDLNDASKTTGSISFPVTSLSTGIDMRDEHLHSAQWLNAAEFPNITFAIKSLNVTSANKKFAHGAAVDAQVTGDITIHGVTKSVTVPVRATYYEITNPQIAGTAYLDGNVLRIETSFKINASDFGISIPEPLRTKVSNELSLTVRVTAKQG
jgi:polyisoprenoid-binding protein YceI